MKKADEKIKLLLVEDNENDRIVFKRFLKRAKFECEIVECERGEEALEAIEAIEKNSSGFDLLVTDHGLPGISGLELCRQLIAENIDMPKIILTGSDSTEAAVEALKMGVSDYLVKDLTGSYLNLLPLIFNEVLKRENNRKEKERAIEALAESEKNLKDIIENSTDLIFGFNEKGKILFSNKAFKETFEYNEGEIKKMSVFDFVATQEKPKIQRILKKIYEENYSLIENSYIETLCLKKDGQVFAVEANGSYFTQPDGSIISVGIMRDITRRKETEEALKTAKEKSEEAAKMKSDFLAAMSHDLRTPLNGIVGFTRLLLKEEHPPEQKQYLEMIKRSSDLLMMLINDILDISKIEAGEMQIEKMPYSLRTLMDDISEIAEMFMKSKGKDLDFRIEIKEMHEDYIIVDPFRLKQILNNLVGNAIKFTHEGHIELGARLKDEKKIEFYVKDTGIGIPEESIDDVFKPFKQAQGSITNKYGGTGLGLAICKKLVHLMGGEIRVKSKTGENHGTVFYFEIPYEKAEKEILQSELEDKISISYNTEDEDNSRFRILVAEDNPVNQLLARKVIESAGYNVEIVEDGSKAVMRYKENDNIDLILMDMQMPVLDGLHATEAIRFLEILKGSRRKMPIIALTADVMAGDIEKTKIAGCNDFLPKPINHDILLKTIKRYISQLCLL
ncbi:MAG: response regulator [Spirochaetia bacterium]|nr:response regulator [Spirochaetia bacterium]